MTKDQDGSPQTGQERHDRRRAWRDWLSLAVVLLLIAIGLLAIVEMLDPDRAARRPFVGTWRLESPAFPAGPELAAEIDLMADGTARDRVWNPRTGAVELEAVRVGRWAVSADGRLQEFIRTNSLFGVIGGHMIQRGWNHRIVWDGPDRLRMEDSTGSRPTMIWVRCDHP
jgi:hypothetical protein